MRTVVHRCAGGGFAVPLFGRATNGGGAASQVWIPDWTIEMRTITTLVALACTVAAPRTTHAQNAAAREVGAPRYAGVGTLREELRIGSLDGDEEYLFGDVGEIVVAKDGTIYVYDSQVPVLRAYDSRGRFLRNLGRKGRGPGEYAASSGIAIARDGRILQWDTGNWRVNVFTPDGASVGSWSFPGSGMSAGSGGLLVDTAGTIYLRRTIRTTFAAPLRIIWLRLDANGSFRDTLHAEPATPPAVVQARAENSSVSMPLPYAAVETRVVSPMGYLLATNSARYEFTIERPGAPPMRFTRRATAERVSSAERALARRYVEKSMRGTDPNWSWNGLEIPSTKPYFGDVTVALDGRIWLQHARHLSERYEDTTGSGGGGGGGGIGGAGRGNAPRRPIISEPRTPQKPKRYDVFEPDGTFIGAVELPGGVSPRMSRGELLWDSVVGDDEALYVKRYRIIWR